MIHAEIFFPFLSFLTPRARSRVLFRIIKRHRTTTRGLAEGDKAANTTVEKVTVNSLLVLSCRIFGTFICVPFRCRRLTVIKNFIYVAVKKRKLNLKIIFPLNFSSYQLWHWFRMLL